VQGLLNFLVRLVLLAAGLVFALCLLFAVLALLAVWGLRYGWARLTGKPVAPFVFRFNPRAGFGRVYRGEWSQAARPADAQHAGAGRPARREIADVTDVDVKEP